MAFENFDFIEQLASSIGDVNKIISDNNMKPMSTEDCNKIMDSVKQEVSKKIDIKPDDRVYTNSKVYRDRNNVINVKINVNVYDHRSKSNHQSNSNNSSAARDRMYDAKRKYYEYETKRNKYEDDIDRKDREWYIRFAKRNGVFVG